MVRYQDAVQKDFPLKNSSKDTRGTETQIGQFTLEGELVAYHDSVFAAAEVTGVQSANIIAAFIGKRADAGDFIWANNQQSASQKAEARKMVIKKRAQNLASRNVKP